jgi:hypothetical protein
VKAINPWLAALLGTALSACPTFAQYCYAPIPTAPDMCGPGFYSANCCGQVYGPGYCVYPPFAPFQGMVGPPKAGSAGAMGCPGDGGPGFISPAFPTHLFARSPRDYFMIDFEPRYYGPPGVNGRSPQDYYGPGDYGPGQENGGAVPPVPPVPPPGPRQ